MGAGSIDALVRSIVMRLETDNANQAYDAFVTCLELENSQLEKHRSMFYQQLEHRSEQARQHAAALLLLFKEPGTEIIPLAKTCLSDWFIFACQAAIDEPELGKAMLPFVMCRQYDEDEDVRTAVAAVLTTPGIGEGLAEALLGAARSHFEEACTAGVSANLSEKELPTLVPDNAALADDAARVLLLRRASLMYVEWTRSDAAKRKVFASHVGFEIKQPRGLKPEWLDMWKSDQVSLQGALEDARKASYRARLSVAPAGHECLATSHAL